MKINNIKFIYWIIPLIIGAVSVELGYAMISALCTFFSFRRDNNKNCNVFGVVNYAAISIYCGVAATMQKIDKISFWDGAGVSTESSFVVLICICLYAGAFDLQYNKNHVAQINSFFKTHDKLNFDLIYLRLIIPFAISLAVIYSYSDLNFVARGLAGDEIKDPFGYIFFSMIPKTFIWSVVSISLISFLSKYSFKKLIVSFIMLSVALSTASIDTTPRQVIFVAFFPLILFFIIRGNYRYIYIYICVWFIVVGLGPVVNYFSRDIHNGVDTLTFPYSPDFDATYIMGSLVDYFDKSGFEYGYGRYLLNAFSFLLPSTYKLFSDYDPLVKYAPFLFAQSNVSLPPFFNAYLDFWFLGVFIFGLMIGQFAKFVDRNLAVYSKYYLVYLVFISSYVPFLRGPVLGWGVFFASGIISYSIICGFCLISNTNRGN